MADNDDDFPVLGSGMTTRSGATDGLRDEYPFAGFHRGEPPGP
jgi:hypothetical protein